MEAWMEPSFFAYLLTYCSGEYSVRDEREAIFLYYTYLHHYGSHARVYHSVSTAVACMHACDRQSFIHVHSCSLID